MESKTQGSRPRLGPRTQNHPRPRTNPLKAKDTTRKYFPRKKDLLKFTARSLARSSRRKKKGHDLGPFFTNQKIVLSSTVNRAFSRTCRLGGQGLFYRGQSKGLQNVLSRTSSRPPPLKNSKANQNKINIFFAEVTEKFVLFLPKSLCHRVACFQAKSHRSSLI